MTNTKHNECGVEGVITWTSTVSFGMLPWLAQSTTGAVAGAVADAPTANTAAQRASTHSMMATVMVFWASECQHAGRLAS